MILVLETSGSFPSVGVIDLYGNELYYFQLLEKQSHAEQLATMVDDAKKFVESSGGVLLAVAVNEGPGSYTGLRIGSSLAKGLCFALGIPLISVPGMLGTGQWFMQKYDNLSGVWVMLDARRDEVYGLFVSNNTSIETQPKAMILPQDFPLGNDLSKVGFVGDCSEKVIRLLQLSDVKSVEQAFISVKHLYSLVKEAFSANIFSDLAYFEPFYLKEFQAGVSKKFSIS